MICPVCRERWADFDDKLFTLREDGFHPTCELSESLRGDQFDSNELKVCSPECQEFVNHSLDAPNTGILIK